MDQRVSPSRLSSRNTRSSRRTGEVPQRVLMTADTVGGVWTYALELAAALRPHGVRVTLAAMGPNISAGQRRAAEAVANLSLTYRRCRLEWMQDPWADVTATGDWLGELADEFRPDVVHLNDYAHASRRWAAPTLVVGHSCVSSWFAAVRGAAPPAAFDEYRRRVSRGLSAAGAVTAPTLAMLDGLEFHYGKIAGIGPIPNGRNHELFVPQAKEPFIVTVGRLWDEAKNLQALDRAAADLPWPVYAAGEARHPDGGAAESFNIRCLGLQNAAELSGLYGRAAIFALPARYEPFGLAALEAGLCGCALVLGDIPSLREVWGDAACFVPPGEPAALAFALDLLVRNESHRKEMAARAFARAREFTPERMAAGYLDAYAGLVAPYSRPRAGPVRAATG